MQGFTRSPARLFGVLAVILCGLFTAQAHADYTDLSLTHEKHIQSFVVNADGTFVLDVERVLRINEERAIKSNAQRSVSYNRTLETLDIVDAYTLKPDGRKVASPPTRSRSSRKPPRPTRRCSRTRGSRW